MSPIDQAKTLQSVPDYLSTHPNMTKKIDLDEARAWVQTVIKLHAHDLISALAHRFQVSRSTASSTIKKLELSGAITRGGSVTRPVFSSTSDVVIMHSYSLPIQDEEAIWQRDYAPMLLSRLTDREREKIHDGFVAVANNASRYSRGSTLHVIVEQSLDNIEMTLQDNGIGVFKHIASDHPAMTTATELLNAQMTVHPHRSITLLAGQFDYFQIEANGMHFPEELAPEIDEETYDQGTTVVLGLTLNQETHSFQ